MELYGRNTSREAPQSEWNPVGPNTGLEESMWRLGIGGGESYPEQHGAPDCAYYMRTGFCGYGSRCRFNHPRDRAAVEATVRATGDYPERFGELSCQYYLKTGNCKFGASCKFNHPKNGGRSTGQVPLNAYGYPLRPGEMECSYYLKTGQCKFGITCKFNHSQPAGTSTSVSAPQFYPPVQSPSIPIPEQYGGASPGLRVTRPPLLPGSYVQGAYGPMLLPPGVVSIPGWRPYSAPLSPVQSPSPQHTVGAASLYGLTQLSTPSLAGVYPSLPTSAGPSSLLLREQSFPDRPGEPECQYYLKTGDCKFGSSCKFHHPLDRVPPRTNCVLSPIGLPLRPGVQPCTFYMQNGHCKFGSTCKFDHPVGAIRYSPSSSSLVDMPVSPYPVGSLLGLGPSSPLVVSKDSYMTRIPSPTSTSTSSIALILSHTGSLPLPDLQTSLPLNTNRSTRQGTEIRRSVS